jgi:hypothetical protein
VPDGVVGVLRVVEVLLAGPLPVAGVVDEADVRERVAGVAAGRVGQVVPDVEGHPVALDHVPVHREGHVRERGHRVHDPLLDGGLALEGAEVVLHVLGVLGEQRRPRRPVPVLDPSPQELGEGLLDLCAWVCHGRRT